MKRNFFALLFGLSIIVFFFYSCEKHNSNASDDVEKKDSEKVMSLDEFNSMLPYIDGGFSVQRSLPVASQDSPNNYAISGIFYGVVENGSASIDGFSVIDHHSQTETTNTDGGRYVDDPFSGRTIEFVIERSDDVAITGKKDEVFTAKLYLPEKIRLTYPKFKFDMSEDSITYGTVIQWNPDPNNDKGIFIKLSYDPIGNDPAIVAIYPLDIDNIIHVTDTGSALLDMKLFDGIPLGAYVDVEITRRNYKIAINPLSNRKYSLSFDDRLYFTAKTY